MNTYQSSNQQAINPEEVAALFTELRKQIPGLHVELFDNGQLTAWWPGMQMEPREFLAVTPYEVLQNVQQRSGILAGAAGQQASDYRSQQAQQQASTYGDQGIKAGR